MGYEHELIIPNEGFPFKLFRFEGKDGHYVREKHWHRSIEIFAVFEGTLTFFINEEKYPLKPGEFILLNSNEIHSVVSPLPNQDRKSTRLNSSHVSISYAVFCLKKKTR